MTTTDLTIESLEFIASLVEIKPKLMKNPKTRKEFLQNIIDSNFHNNIISDLQIDIKTSNRNRREHGGYIIDHIASYLKENEGQIFSSTELSNKLSIPQPTVRTYIRNLAASDCKFKIIKGRPNFIGYNSK